MVYNVTIAIHHLHCLSSSLFGSAHDLSESLLQTKCKCTCTCNLRGTALIHRVPLLLLFLLKLNLRVILGNSAMVMYICNRVKQIPGLQTNKSNLLHNSVMQTTVVFHMKYLLVSLVWQTQHKLHCKF